MTGTGDFGSQGGGKMKEHGQREGKKEKEKSKQERKV